MNKIRGPFGIGCAGRIPAILSAGAVTVFTGTSSAQAPSAPTAQVKISGGLSYGIGVRASEPSPDLLFANNAPLVGLTSPNPAGRNQDDGNMNYRKGDLFSNVLKGFADLSVTHGNYSGLVRVHAWHDIELADGKLPWGHTANGLTPDKPLSDAGARARGKFSNIVLSDAWVRGRLRAVGIPVTVTAGQQGIGWRGMGLMPGPLAVLDPADLVARSRPGAFAEEGSIPVPALRAAFKIPGDIEVDTFWQLEFRASQTALCGTFLAPADRTLDGCDKTMVNAGAGTNSDRVLLATNRFVKLGSISQPDDTGQFGIAAAWNVPQWRTGMRLAYARYHSRSTYTNMRKSLIPGNNPFTPLDSRNPQTEVIYPEGIQTLAFEFRHELRPATLYGSVGYSPNQPLAYPAGEVFQAFVAPVTSASLFRAQERATAPGGLFEGWDRRRTSAWQLGYIHPLRNVLGAAGMTLRAELNASMVHDLPNPNELRFGRAEVFGIGPIGGVCAAGASALTCSNKGYVSRSAWGYNLQAIATWQKVFGRIDLRPRAALAHNVRGTSWDGTLREGRKTVLIGLDAVQGRTTVNLTLVRHQGGDYDNASDRNFIAASVATRF